jgi:hypothetical protein
MTAWTPDELDHIAAVDEVRITTTRPDGALRAWVPIWIARAGDELYVQSHCGTGGAWYRHATEHRVARIRVGSVERDVTVAQPDDASQAAIDAAYRAKYARCGPTYLQPMLAAEATAATVRLTPRD